MKFRFKRMTGKRKLAATVLTLVEEDEHYNQRVWLNGAYFKDLYEVVNGQQLRERLGQCGTKGCVAGNVVVLSLGKDEKFDSWDNNIILANGDTQRVKTYAREKLGISYDEATWLFSEWRPVEQVKGALRVLMAGHKISDKYNVYQGI